MMMKLKSSKENCSVIGQIIAVLAIALAAAVIIAGTNVVTRDRIAANSAAAERAEMFEIFPQAEDFSVVADGIHVATMRNPSLDAPGMLAYDLLGYIVNVTAEGPAGDIELLVGVDGYGYIERAIVLSSSEVLMGAMITDDLFLMQFTSQRDIASVQAIVGAEESSQAVIDGVAEALARLNEFFDSREEQINIDEPGNEVENDWPYEDEREYHEEIGEES
ncbi:MAG: hypothetical protein FWE06_05030 [Oscillospiraceae bacterium]|nr:hypothetical protein [Oscillospiraceae bacterium]